MGRVVRHIAALGNADGICVNQPSWRNPLFRRLAVKMFLVGLRVGSSVVDDAIAMVGRRVERIEFQR